MNFEKIEVYGFKSFADKEVIKFGSGITGIVGPNGCGKSNVADAIRWVLGEQSAKNLRGSSMQDVIFSGTQSRKSLSYCEVSLYFDNSNKMFSLDYSEIIITRKLYRSGESEYFINKQPSRLRDIVDLLHECGIGKDGYTIIGQGKVQEIMSAKPEDRRAIFEEATGISKFKAKKNESERKLDRTRENLIRYSDILSELETQLEPLERQAEKTRKYREYAEQLKHHEINVYVYKTENVANAKAQINEKIKAISEETALRQSEYETASKGYDDTLNKINNLDNKLNTLHDELLEKTVYLEKQMGNAKLFSERISYLRTQVERAEIEIKENQTAISGNKEKIKENERLILEGKKRIKDLEERLEKLSKELMNVTVKIAENEDISSESRKKVIESIESLSTININKGSLGAELSVSKVRHQELSKELLDLQEKRDKQFAEKEALDVQKNGLDKSIYNLRNAITDKESEIKEANDKVAEIDNAIYNTNSNLTMLTAKENFYTGLKESYEGYQPAVKRLMISAKEDKVVGSKIKGVVASIIKTDKKFDVAMEVCLGGAAQNIVTDSTDDAKYLIEYLKKTKSGRVTFLPVSSVKPRQENDSIKLAIKERGAIGVADKLVTFDPYYKNVISNLLGNTLIVDNIENATFIANKYRFSFKIVTLEGDVFSTQGSMSGGSRRQDAPNLLAGDRQLDEIKALIEEKKATLKRLRAEKEIAESNRDKIMDEYEKLNESYQQQRQEIVVVSEKLQVAENALIENNKLIESVSDQLEIIEQRIEKINSDFELIKSGSDKLEADKKSATSLESKHQTEYEALKKKRDELVTESTSLQLELSNVKNELSTLSSEIDRLNAEISVKEGEIANAIKSNESAEEIIETLKRDAEKVALSKEEQDKINALRENITGIEEEKATLREQLTKLDAEKQFLLAEINNLTDKLHAQEINLTKIDSDIEYAQQRIWEEYQETYETAQRLREENYDVKAGEEEILKLKRRISNLGSINPNAIDDFNALKERQTEMISQKEDMEKAEADLKEGLDTLKKEMLTQFDSGFKKINENFTKIFKELFGGGRAMLELDYTNAVDPLDAGVEIIAEPPGKKLQKLSLLSGGEQALTAISILFSILKLRPMPFCVLDEIEAALDEANVDRFARYLQKFSTETQFIVITHRKPTMELADALFGVTMPEKGVSKTVSVKLSDVSYNAKGDIIL